MKGSVELAQTLLRSIYTVQTLKDVSHALEKLSQNKGFKIHTSEIIADDSLTDSQKKNQLLYIIKSIDIPLLNEFFTDQLADNSFWFFSSGTIDYFDKFVGEFQKATESIKIVKIVTAVSLDAADLKAIAQNISKWYSYQVLLEHEINPGIIGGIQIQIENLVFDYSVRSKFRHFTKEWLHSITDTQNILGFHD